MHVGYQFWNRLGLGNVLRDVGIPSSARQLACAMILNRLIQPAAEHAMPDWIRRTALADILGTGFEALAEDPLYRVLDKLHPHRAAIEAALVERERSLFNPGLRRGRLSTARSTSTTSPRLISRVLPPPTAKPNAVIHATTARTASRW